MEVDILADGRLDLPEEDLRRLDLVVAAVHSHLADPAERMTARVERALHSGVVHVLGHPSGRQIGTRDACALDLEAVAADGAVFDRASLNRCGADGR